jgi:DNA segregation ATPase FtsK/SpoIIIE, S-DNA-T family
VEFKAYNEHAVVVYNYADTVSMLKVLVSKMESRFEHMSELGIKSVEENPSLFPFVVVVIDEVADLMIQDKKTHIFETLVVRLAQKARAAGIYLVLATQRPSRDVLTGTIKANFPARIACKTSSRVDSQVVLDMPGAEELLGRGDAILRNQEYDRARFQVAFSTPERSIKLADYLKNRVAN